MHFCTREKYTFISIVTLLAVVMNNRFCTSSLFESNDSSSPSWFYVRQGGFPKFPFLQESTGAKNCGTRTVYHSPPKKLATEPMLKIVGGLPVPNGAYPWTAHLEGLSFDGFEHICGGTIVSEYHIVTAAHCIHGYGFKEVRIKIGDISSDHLDQSEETFEVETWKVHPEFQKGGVYDNDIAVIKIKSTKNSGIKFNDFVSPACLPSRTTHYTPGTWCFISGWGVTDLDVFYPSNIQQAASVQLISDSVCKSNRILGSKKIKPGMMCAGHLDGEIDACNGDSGGPLVCEENGLFTLFGVVSWGVECAKSHKPGVYSNVQYYLDFVEQAMNL